MLDLPLAEACFAPHAFIPSYAQHVSSPCKRHICLRRFLET